MKFKNLLILTTIVLMSFGVISESVYATGEFLVNTTADYYQNGQGHSSVANDSDGNFVITWRGTDSPGGSEMDIYAKRYDSNGTPAGGEFLVNTTADYYQNNQLDPSVAMNSDGDFVITWCGFDSPGGSSADIYARRYNSDGTPAGGEFLVNTTADYYQDSQLSPSVGMDSDGDFVITWYGYDSPVGASSDIFARRYNSDGTPASSEFLVNNTSDYYQNDQFTSTLAMDSDGDFVITWFGYGLGGAGYDIYAKRYNSDGSAAGGEFLVNDSSDYYQNNQSDPSVAMDADGDFVITWFGNDSPGGASDDIYARRYNSDGTPASGEFLVNTTADYYQNVQRYSSVAMDSDGDFVITWRGFSSPGGEIHDIYARKYNSDGSPASGEFLVNDSSDYYQDFQTYPSVALSSDWNFLIAWHGNGLGGSGGQYDYDIYAKYYQQEDNDAITLDSFAAKAEGRVVILEWKTGTEIDNLGFYLVRSESTDYGYILLNNEIIPAQGNVYSGHSYRYVDSEVNAGYVYCYWLADLDIFGKCTIHGPVKVITNLERFDSVK